MYATRRLLLPPNLVEYFQILFIVLSLNITTTHTVVRTTNLDGGTAAVVISYNIQLFYHDVHGVAMCSRGVYRIYLHFSTVSPAAVNNNCVSDSVIFFIRFIPTSLRVQPFTYVQLGDAREFIVNLCNKLKII